MTGRELIVYILTNGLEDEPAFKDGVFIGFVSEFEFAKKFNVGIPTVRAWLDLGIIEGVRVGEAYYFPCDYLNNDRVRDNDDR